MPRTKRSSRGHVFFVFVVVVVVAVASNLLYRNHETKVGYYAINCSI